MIIVKRPGYQSLWGRLSAMHEYCTNWNEDLDSSKFFKSHKFHGLITCQIEIPIVSKCLVWIIQVILVTVKLMKYHLIWRYSVNIIKYSTNERKKWKWVPLNKIRSFPNIFTFQDVYYHWISQNRLWCPAYLYVDSCNENRVCLLNGEVISSHRTLWVVIT